MFWALIHENAERDSSRPAILSLASQTNWGQLSQQVREFESQLAPLDFGRCALRFSPDAASIALAAALDRLKKDVFLVDPDQPDEIIDRIVDRFELQACLSAKTIPDKPTSELRFERSDHCSAAKSSVQGSSVTILTSGTTGTPKAARHSWQSLMRPVRKSSNDDPKRWFLSYRPHLYAGLQVLLQAFVNHSPIVVSLSAETARQFEVLNQQRVQCISGTPSFFRKLFLTIETDQIRQIPLEQITLGGELVDQQILDQLSNVFPSARVAHIYATTELGRCFSVTDGLSGFPASFLDKASDGVQLKVEDGQLCVRSENSMSDYDHLVDSGNQLKRTSDGWICTGDLVEIQRDRVYFVGRKTDLINVGGNKVNPMLVENVVREVDNVLDVRVYGKDSTIAGQIVACDIVVSKENPEETKQRVLKHCLMVLDRFHRPRIVNVVDEIKLSSAGKKTR